jgi:hypothetical protein
LAFADVLISSRPINNIGWPILASDTVPGGVIRCLARRAAEAVAGSFITSPTNLNLDRGQQYRCLTELTARRFNGEKGGDERMPRIGSSLRAVTKICAQQAL